jgi:uncharacterized protein
MVILFLTLLCISSFLCLPTAAVYTDRVYDPDGLLSAAEADSLTERLNSLAAEHGVELYLATYVADNRFDDFYGDDYCATVKNLRGEDAVLLVVTLELANRTFYYNMYTYGEANYAISQKEVDYILDSGGVYNNLKSGYLADGAASFFDQSAKAFTGRVGVSWGVIITISACIALVIALMICGGVVAAYKHKRATVDYPLDRYAKLDLTRQSDNFVREYVTRTYSPRSGGSGGGGGGGRHGGGGGHRGGR